MLHSLCNKKGVTLVEVLTAIVLTSIGIMSLLSLQNPSWQNVARADYLGRATAILYKTLETNEALILNPCNIISTATVTNNNVHPSDQASAISGDVTYTVTTSSPAYQYLDANNITRTYYVVTVTVTWPTNSTGITESLTVTRQEFNRYPANCQDSTL